MCSRNMLLSSKPWYIIDFRIKFDPYKGIYAKITFFSLRDLTINSLEQCIATT